MSKLPARTVPLISLPSALLALRNQFIVDTEHEAHGRRDLVAPLKAQRQCAFQSVSSCALDWR
jgi:hypothetical protein